MTAPDLVDLARIARALEDEGRYLAARLFHAALHGEATRRSEARPRSDEEVAGAIDAVVPHLEAAGHDAALVSAIRSVSRMLRAAEDRFEGDMADLHVCRLCGREMVGTVPERCPSCGAGTLSFERVLPIYFLEPLPSDRLIAALAELPERVSRLCRSVPEEDAAHGEWPLREVLSHLVGAQRLLGGRAVRTLEEDEPQLRPVPSAAVTTGTERRPTVADLLSDLRTGRDELLGLFRGISAAQWERVGHHGEWGPITIRQQLSYIARHEHSHLGHLQRAAQGVRRGQRAHPD